QSPLRFRLLAFEDGNRASQDIASVAAGEWPTVSFPNSLDIETGLPQLVDVATPARPGILNGGAPVFVRSVQLQERPGIAASNSQYETVSNASFDDHHHSRSSRVENPETAIRVAAVASDTRQRRATQRWR